MKFGLKLIGFVSVSILFTGVVRATDYTWTNAAGGDYSAAGNWTPSGGPPAADDTAILDGAPSAAVALSVDVTNHTLQAAASAGPITLDLAGKRLALTNYTAGTSYQNWAFYVKPNAALTVTSSSAGGSIKGLDISTATKSTSLFVDEGATLTYDGGNTAVSQLQARVAAGGLWHIKGGADVTLGADPSRGTSYYFGNDPDEPALIVDGAGSTYWDVTRYVRNCSIVITNGGYALGYRSSYIGHGGGTGKVLITGTGSRWAGYSPEVQVNSAYYITVTNGGWLDTGLALALVNDAYAQCLITGAGSKLDNSGYLQICRLRSSPYTTYTGSTGLLEVVNGGYVNQRFLSMGPGGILRLDDGEVLFHWGATPTSNWERRSIMDGGGLVEGNGLIRNSATAGTRYFHNNGGVVRPGLSGGTLTFKNFDGGFTNEPTAETHFELGGTNSGEYGRLVLDNCKVCFDGAMRVTLIDGFKPEVGDRFPLIDFSSSTVNGTFAIVLLPVLDGADWNLDDLYVDGSISVVEKASDEALTFTWKSPAGGDYSQAGFWDPMGGPPGWNDTAVITGALSGNITLTRTVTNDTLRISNATATVNLDGYDLRLLNDTNGTPYDPWGFYCRGGSSFSLTNDGATASTIGGTGVDSDGSPHLHVGTNASLIVYSNVQVSAASARIDTNATLDLQGGRLTTTAADGVVIDKATLSGYGTMNNVATAASALIIRDGIVAPGGDGTGRLLIDGFDTVSLSSSCDLHILITGTNDWQYDAFLVSDGELQLGGTLTVALPRFHVLPTNGASYRILDWSALSGTFDNIVLPDRGSWITNDLYVDGTISSEAYVPVPDPAMVYTWTNAAGGDYSEALNWDPNNGPPGTNDTARLYSTAPLTVFLSDPYLTNHSLQAAGGPVTLDLNGLSLPLINFSAGTPYTNWAVYCLPNSQLLVTNSGASANLGTLGSSLADSASVFIDSNAVLTVAGTGTTLNASYFRTRGDGRLVVRNGGHAVFGSDPVRSTCYYVGNDPLGKTTAVVVDGTGSTYWAVSPFFLDGAMLVTNGGYAFSYRTMTLGDTSGFRGGLICSGPGSIMNPNPLFIANGYMRVENGGVISTVPHIGRGDNSRAEVLVTGSGSLLSGGYLYLCGTDTDPFSGATGRLWIADDARVEYRYVRMWTGGTVRLEDGRIDFIWSNYDRRSANDGGRVEGIGTIRHTVGSDTWFVNSGVIDPGLPGRTGTLTFQGWSNFGIGSESELEFTLGGVAEGELDRLVFTNCGVTLGGGTLRIMLADGYALPSRAIYDIIDWPTAGPAGTFDTVELPNTGDWSIDNLYVDGTISVFFSRGTLMLLR
jgi:hypothetical protein